MKVVGLRLEQASLAFRAGPSEVAFNSVISGLERGPHARVAAVADRRLTQRQQRPRQRLRRGGQGERLHCLPSRGRGQQVIATIVLEQGHCERRCVIRSPKHATRKRGRGRCRKAIAVTSPRRAAFQGSATEAS